MSFNQYKILLKIMHLFIYALEQSRSPLLSAASQNQAEHGSVHG